MPNREHQQAQERAIQAKLKLDASDEAQARRLYAEAADFEKASLLKIDPTKIRTRSILAVSLVSLLYKAQRFEEAEAEIYRLLSGEVLTTSARIELRELLEVVWDEKTLLDQGFQYARDDLLVALRGGQIGAGTAPLDLVVQKANGFRVFLYRIAEWIGKRPFRHRGLPPPDILHALQLRASQPAPGSYRFTVRLVEPAQRILFEEMQEQPIKAGDVAASAVRIIKLLNAGGVDDLTSYVPESDYRRALTRIVRNLTPTKRDAKEIEVRRVNKPRDESVTLVRGSRTAINEIMKASLEEDKEIREIRGTLRALDLDRQWVDIATKSGKRKRCKTPPDFLDDVVGPMVNRAVIAYGKKGGRSFFLRDIELDEEGED